MKKDFTTANGSDRLHYVYFGCVGVILVISGVFYSMYNSAVTKLKNEANQSQAVSVSEFTPPALTVTVGDGVELNTDSDKYKGYIVSSMKQSGMEYADTLINEYYYKDVVLSAEEEKEAKDHYIDSYFGTEENFKQYLEDSGNISEDDIMRDVYVDAKKNKLINDAIESTVVSDEEVKAYYDANPSYYSHWDTDVAISSDKDKLDAFLSTGEAGEGVEYMEEQVLPDSQTMFLDQLDLETLNKFQIVDMGGTYYAVKLKKHNNTFDDVKEFVKEDLTASNAEQKINDELAELRASAVIKIDGEEQHEKPINN